VSKFGVLDIALVEASLTKQSLASADRSEVDAAMAECAYIMAAELEEEELQTDTAEQWEPIATAALERCSNGGGIGQQHTLMAQVEAIIDARSLHYIIPSEVCRELGMQN
jgi:hypothetical protein